MKNINKRFEIEKKKGQQEKFKLIKESNLLREDTHKLTTKVQMLEKKFQGIQIQLCLKITLSFRINEHRNGGFPNR